MHTASPQTVWHPLQMLSHASICKPACQHASHHAFMTQLHSQQGHSLLDTLFVLFVLAILCGVAASGFQTLQTSFHLQSSAEELHSAVLTTRTQALRLEKRVTLCAAAPLQEAAKGVNNSATQTTPQRCHLLSDGSFVNVWRQGWLMFEDDNNNGVWDEGENKLQQQAPLPRSVSASGNTTVSHFVSFGASGRSLALNGAFQAGTLSICERAIQNASGWRVVVNAIGRPRLEKMTIADCPA